MFQGDNVIGVPPLLEADNNCSTPESIVITVGLSPCPRDATTITASPVCSSPTVSAGNRASILDRSIPAPRGRAVPAPPAAAPPAAAPPLAAPRFANIAPACAGSFRTSEFAVTFTVTVCFVVRSFSVTVPAAASTPDNTPDRFSNVPVTTSSAVMTLPSSDFAPRTLIWSPACTCASVPGLASSKLTESSAYRRKIVLLEVFTVSVFAPTAIVSVVPSTPFTSPLVPCCCHSACCFALQIALSDAFIRITREAVAVSPVLPVITRSPLAISAKVAGVACFKFVPHGGSFSTTASEATATGICVLPAVVTLSVLPVTPATVPVWRTPGIPCAQSATGRTAKLPIQIFHLQTMAPLTNTCKAFIHKSVRLTKAKVSPNSLIPRVLSQNLSLALHQHLHRTGQLRILMRHRFPQRPIHLDIHRPRMHLHRLTPQVLHPRERHPYA